MREGTVEGDRQQYSSDHPSYPIMREGTVEGDRQQYSSDHPSYL